MTFKMKICQLYICLLLFASNVTAQSISPEVIASNGDYFSTAFGSVSFTTGEVIIETISNTNVVITQGFQQPWPFMHVSTNEIIVGDEMSIFPNPAQNYSKISFGVPGMLGGVLRITDASGKLILSEQIKNSEMHFQLSLAKGIYFVEAEKEGSVVTEKLVLY